MLGPLQDHFVLIEQRGVHHDAERALLDKVEKHGRSPGPAAQPSHHHIRVKDDPERHTEG